MPYRTANTGSVGGEVLSLATILPGADLKVLGGFIIDIDGPVTIVGDTERPITLSGRQTGSTGTWDGLRLHGPGNKILNHVNMSYGGADAPETDAIEIDRTGNECFAVQIDNTEITDSASWGIFVKGDRCTTSIGDAVTYWNNAVGNFNVPQVSALLVRYHDAWLEQVPQSDLALENHTLSKEKLHY